jgi:hypothetical protein
MRPILTYKRKLSELFPPDDPTSSWMLRLAILRDDLEHEYAEMGPPVHPNEPSMREVWRTMYSARKICVTLEEVRNIFVKEASAFVKGKRVLYLLPAEPAFDLALSYINDASAHRFVIGLEVTSDRATRTRARTRRPICSARTVTRSWSYTSTQRWQRSPASTNSARLRSTSRGLTRARTPRSRLGWTRSSRRSSMRTPLPPELSMSCLLSSGGGRGNEARTDQRLSPEAPGSGARHAPPRARVPGARTAQPPTMSDSLRAVEPTRPSTAGSFQGRHAPPRAPQ